MRLRRAVRAFAIDAKDSALGEQLELITLVLEVADRTAVKAFDCGTEGCDLRKAVRAFNSRTEGCGLRIAAKAFDGDAEGCGIRRAVKALD